MVSCWFHGQWYQLSDRRDNPILDFKHNTNDNDFGFRFSKISINLKENKIKFGFGDTSSGLCLINEDEITMCDRPDHRISPLNPEQKKGFTNLLNEFNDVITERIGPVKVDLKKSN